MSSLYKRLCDIRTFSANEKQALTDVLDLGAYTKLEIQPRVVKAGTAGNLVLKHSAVLEDEAFVQLATVAFNPTSNTPISVSNFLRYLRWETDANVAGSPVGLVDVVAKLG